jgi:hypothetical protein
MKRIEGNMLVLGREPTMTPWQATRRNQRRAALISPRIAAPPGVYCFDSHEAADEWMLTKQIAASRKKRT